MKFWDSSALVTLLVGQQASALCRQICASDNQIVVWFLSDVEVRSALCRLERDGAISLAELQRLIARQDSLWNAVHAVQPGRGVVSSAKRLLAIHPLRAADSLQLAAALAAAYGSPSSCDFVCLDQRLRSAAVREGFAVLP